MKSFSLAVGFVFMVVLTACNGNEFIAFPSGADAAGDDIAAPDNQVDDGAPDGRDAKMDETVESEASTSDATETDSAADVADAGMQDVVAEVGEDAKPDIVEAGQDAIPDVIVDAGPDVDFDAGPVSLCEQFGTNGQTTVIVKVVGHAPAGKVLGIFGKSTVFGPDGGSIGYEIWVQAQDSDQLAVIATPIPAVDSAVLLFDPGFAEIGDTYFAGWTPLCPGTGCPDTSRIIVCRDLEVVGSINGTVSSLACDMQTNDWGWSEVHCILSAP